MEQIGSYTTIFIALGVGVFCLAAGIFVSWLVRPMNPTPLKMEPYECGEPAIGPARVKFRTSFYLFALVFVIFDVEVVFLFPWAVVFQDLGLFAFIEMVIFIFILLLGLAYAWRKGALRWR